MGGCALRDHERGHRLGDDRQWLPFVGRRVPTGERDDGRARGRDLRARRGRRRRAAGAQRGRAPRGSARRDRRRGRRNARLADAGARDPRPEPASRRDLPLQLRRRPARMDHLDALGAAPDHAGLRGRQGLPRRRLRLAPLLRFRRLRRRDGVDGGRPRRRPDGGHRLQGPRHLQHRELHHLRRRRRDRRAPLEALAGRSADEPGRRRGGPGDERLPEERQPRVRRLPPRRR